MAATAAPSQPIVWVHPRLKRLLAALLLLLLLPAGWWSYGRVMWLTPTGEEIAGVVRAAASKNVVLFQPPASYRYRNVPRRDIDGSRRRAFAGLQQIYAGHELAGWQRVARRVYAGARTSSWRTWYPYWSMSWVRLDTLRILPGSVTATVSAQEINILGDVSRMDYTFGLTHTSTGWRIVKETSDFEPGYGP